MKTTEMLRQIRELGFHHERTIHFITIKNQDDYNLARINTDKKYQIDTYFVGQEILSPAESEKLFIILTKFAHTPLNER